MKYTLLLFALFLCSCSNPSSAPPDATPPPSVPPTAPPDDSSRLIELNSYMIAFNNAYSYYAASPQTRLVDSSSLIAVKYSGNVPQSFDDLSYLGPSVIGVCYRRGNGSRDIQYDRSWWNQLSSIQRKELVFHESGHCLLTRSHRCGTININNDIPSIMYPSIWDTQSLSYNGSFNMFDFMSVELFDRRFQLINDCPTATLNHKLINDNGDIAQPDSYEDIFNVSH